MRFNIYINQVKSLEWDLTLPQAALMSFCYEIASWAQPITIENDIYFFASKNKIVQELPLVSSKRDTIYRFLKILEEKGLIKYRSGVKDYIHLTQKGKEWNSDYNPNTANNSDCNPTKLGFSSETNSDFHPTNNVTKENNNTKIKFRSNILLEKKEHDKLVSDVGEELTNAAYDYLSGYKMEKPTYKTKSDYHTILRWVIDAVKRKIPAIQGIDKKMVD